MRQLGYDRVYNFKESLISIQATLISIQATHSSYLCFELLLFCSLQIVLFQFGLGANAHYVILELYAQGNIILTDSDFMVMTLLRSHRLVILNLYGNIFVFCLSDLIF